MEIEERVINFEAENPDSMQYFAYAKICRELQGLEGAEHKSNPRRGMFSIHLNDKNTEKVLSEMTYAKQHNVKAWETPF